MMAQTQNSFFEVLRANVEMAKSLLPRRRVAPVVTMGARFEPKEPVEIKAPSAPLPPCKPLNKTEASEAATLSQLRGALYPSDL